MGDQPFLSTKGDLLTTTGTSIARLPVGTSQSVLTADPGEPTGLKWKPAGALGTPGTKDWFYWPPGLPGRWVVPGFGVGDLAANDSIANDTLIALPLVCSRGGSIDTVAVNVAATPGSGTQLVLIGVYSNVSDTEAYPDALIAQVSLSTATTGVKIGTLDSTVSASDGSLLWFVMLASDAPGLIVITSVTVQGGPYPILGFGGPAEALASIGWSVGYDSSGMGMNTWPFTDGLPSTFPASGETGVATLKAGANPASPAIFVQR
jgi:hypothetical protein